MPHTATALEREFVRDHQVLTQGFSQILGALEENNWTSAVEAARKVNREAGRHIAFEEAELYPRVAQQRGADFSRQLVEEHRIATDAIRFLLQHPTPDDVQPEERMELIDEVQTGLDHAISCGTLLSHLTVLDAETQQKLLDSLEQCRKEAKQMTDLRD